MEIGLKPRNTPGAAITLTENGWRLDLPGGPSGVYRLAQFDDYASLSRRQFPHSPPYTVSLQARVSAANLPGTWGFGLWNDPFGLSVGFGGTAWRLPALPEAAWFFHASPPNWLAFRDGIPAHGFYAGTIRSPRLPSLLLAPGLVAAPLLAIRPLSLLLRRLAARTVRQEGAAVRVDVTEWHEYSFKWLYEGVQFEVDGEILLQTPVSPHPPLGLVMWIDNQFAAWKPDGRLGYGMLENPPAWLEIINVVMT
jgi:hypothetical protein